MNMSKSVWTTYNHEASETYDEMRFVTRQGIGFDKLEWEQLKSDLKHIPSKGSKSLEVGCGTGRFLYRFGSLGYTVRGVDPSLHMIDIAKDKCSEYPHVTYGREEGDKLQSLNDNYDFVYSIRVTNQTESPEYAIKMIREMIRVAKHGGYVLVEFFNSKRLIGTKSSTVRTRLSFDDLDEIALSTNTDIVMRSGILFFSQKALDVMPGIFVPLWLTVERVFSKIFVKLCSRGYVLIKKN